MYFYWDLYFKNNYYIIAYSYILLCYRNTDDTVVQINNNKSVQTIEQPIQEGNDNRYLIIKCIYIYLFITIITSKQKVTHTHTILIML